MFRKIFYLNSITLNTFYLHVNHVILASNDLRGTTFLVYFVGMQAY